MVTSDAKNIPIFYINDVKIIMVTKDLCIFHHLSMVSR